MDSHHQQVEQARRQADPNVRRLYFGYSTVLDRSAFDEWKVQHGYSGFELPPGELAQALDVELVFDFPSRWWGGRVAGLTNKAGSVVHGRLFEVGGADWPIVQHKEGAITGMSVEREVEVSVGGKKVFATAFVTSPNRASQDGPVSERFVEAFLRGARAAGLPEPYLARAKELAK